jgi:metallo-beta-lactamase class B
MIKKVLAGVGVTICTVTVLQLHVDAQGRGGRGGGPEFPTAKQFAESTVAQKHVAAAMALAKSDLVNEAKAFCTATGPQREALARQAAGLPPIADYVLEPTRVFENLYYIGFNDVGAWAIQTSDGIILIDTLNSSDEARDVLVPGLKKMGLDPARIRYIILGHGHNDHTGGASYLQGTYEARVLMGGPDWDSTIKGQRPDRPAPKRDIVVTDGQKITLGDTTVTLALTPGHTPGTLAVLFPVKHRGRTHTAMLMSGSQMPTRESLAAFEHVFNDIAKPLKPEAAVYSHPGVLLTLDTLTNLRQRYSDGPHPLLYGEERFGRYLSIMLECGRARLAAVESAAP